MKILAIDSSGLVASVALVDGENMIAEYTLNYRKTHSQTLLPMVNEIVTMTETDLSDIDAIAVAAGPGSFTGLRIGSATAKGLGLALDKPLIPVPTLEGLASNYYGYQGLICPMMDARRQQVYTGVYRFDGDRMSVVKDQTACPVTEIIEEINALGQAVIYLGDGLPVYRDTIVEKTLVPHMLAPAHMNRQRAGAVARRAMDYLSRGITESAADHAPIYIRKSQAERELNARGGSLED